MKEDWNGWGDGEIARRCVPSEFSTLRVPQKVEALLMLRVAALSELPEHDRPRAASWRQAWSTADVVWNAIGMPAQGFDYYSRRLILAVAWKPLAGRWADDTSPDRGRTREALNARLASVGRLFGPINRTRKWVRSLYGAG